MIKNKLPLLASTVFLVLLAVACGTSESSSDRGEGSNVNEANAGIWQTVSVEEFKTHMNDEGATVVDVRTDAEIVHGIIASAVQIELNSANMEVRFAELDKSKPVLIYCAAGGRSKKAMRALKDMGFLVVYELEGGMGAWQNAGMETSQP